MCGPELRRRVAALFFSRLLLFALGLALLTLFLNTLFFGLTYSVVYFLSFSAGNAFVYSL